MHNEEDKMSLTAQFDDLCRFTSLLKSDIESEFIKFVQNQDDCRKRWLAAEKELSRIRSMMSKAESEIKALETKLVHARNLTRTEMNKRKIAENEKGSLQCQIALIRELITDHNVVDDQTREKFALLETTSQWNNKTSPTKPLLNTINEMSAESLIDSSIIDFDESNNCLEDKNNSLRSRGKRSSSYSKNDDSAKRRKSSSDDENDNKMHKSLITTTTVTVPISGEIHATTRVEAGKKKRRSNYKPSAPILSSTDEKSDSDTSKGTYCVEPQPIVKRRFETGNTVTPDRPIPMKNYSSAGKLNERAHAFCQKLIIYPETCGPCGRKIMFYKPALKCENCRLTCHPDCKNKAPLPCIPNTATPTRKAMGVISDYTPLTAPMIPSIIIHCINEVEKRGMNEVGIYRLSGSEKDIKELKEKFRHGRGCPNLAREDIHVICSVIKDFLRSLKEPLIPSSMWHQFVNAAEMDNVEDRKSAIYEAISELPQPNRDTLAFLIKHLQYVSECTDCKMPPRNLAMVFGPTIVGYTDVQNMEKMVSENAKQQAVVMLFLTVSNDYWSKFVNVEQDNLYSKAAFTTPESRRAPYSSMLGPLTNSGQKNKNGSLSNRAKNMFGRTPTSTRNAGSRSGRRAQYFESPMLK